MRLALAVLVAATAAQADWEGTLRMTTTPARPEGEEMQGKIHARKTKMRMDVQMRGHQVSSILDPVAKRATVLMHEQRTYMEMDLEHAAQRGMRPMPSCKSVAAAACLKEQGYAKIGAEKVNGQPTTRWERKQDGREEAIWVPDGFKDFAFVRHVASNSAGVT